MPTVAELLIDGLIHAGVSRLFGVPRGGSNLELLEAARLRGLPFILCHQESAACIMAAVTGELTGCPGAAVATLGPGVTASATGLAHAFLDRSPMILVTDRHPEAALAFTTHQRVDHAAHLGPIVKESLRVTADSVSHRVAHAVTLALKEPRGPVHLDVPADLGAELALPLVARGAAPPSPAPDGPSLDRGAALISGARRPVVLAGLQCRAGDAKWLRAFSEALPAPVLTTWKAKGALPDPHPLALGVVTGGALEEPLLDRADLIVALGLDTVELMPRPWRYSAPVLSLSRCASSDPGLRTSQGAAYFTAATEVVGDLASILDELAPRLRARRSRTDWDVGEIERLRRRYLAALDVVVPGLAPHRVVQIARELTAAGTIATVDAGAHMFPATAYWHATEIGELLISNGLATMGFALPAAIAGQLVHPDRRVLCFTGDGGLMMVAAELETVARLSLPIVIVALNDGALSPDLAALARCFGIGAWSVSEERTFQEAFLGALAAPGPSLIDARIDASGYRRTLEIVRGAWATTRSRGTTGHGPSGGNRDDLPIAR